MYCSTCETIHNATCTVDRRAVDPPQSHRARADGDATPFVLDLMLLFLVHMHASKTIAVVWGEHCKYEATLYSVRATLVASSLGALKLDETAERRRS